MTPVGAPVAERVGASFVAASSQYLSRTEASWRPDEAGTLMAWVRPSSFAAVMCLFASADDATDNFYFEWITTNTGVQYVYVYENGVAIGVASGTTALQVDVWQRLTLTSDGSNYLFYVNGVLDPLAGGATDSGAWLADVSNRDNVTIGALLHNSGPASFYGGQLKDVRYYSRVLT